MKRLVLAVALACALSGTALAGDFPSTGAPSPGDFPSTGAPESSDVVTAVILAILSVVS